jgi:autophagy-related protein 18
LLFPNSDPIRKHRLWRLVEASSPQQTHSARPPPRPPPRVPRVNLEDTDGMAAAADEVLCASFNQLHSHVALGTRRGWKLAACSPFGDCAASAQAGGCSLVCMLFASSLVAIVGRGEHADDSPRRLRLWNTSTSSVVFELTFASNLLNVQMNRTRLMVVLEEATHVFELSTMKMLQTLESAPNPRGVCALSSASESSTCAVFPSGTAPGWIGKLVLYDATRGYAMSTVAAHSSNVCCVALDARGQLMATASEKGTVIRVHSVPTGSGHDAGSRPQLLHTLRRGQARVTIHTLSFATSASVDHEPSTTRSEGSGLASSALASEADDPDGATHDAGPSGAAAAAAAAAAVAPGRPPPLLCVASSTGTVHVWRLDHRHRQQRQPRHLQQAAAAASEGGALSRRRLLSLRGLLDASATAERDLCRVKLRLPPKANWCAAAILDQRSEAERGESGLAGGDAVGGGGGVGGGEGGASLFVVTQHGEFYAFDLDVASGKCRLRDERRLLHMDDAHREG